MSFSFPPIPGRWCRREWTSPAADARSADPSRGRGILYQSVFLGSPGKLQCLESHTHKPNKICSPSPKFPTEERRLRKEFIIIIATKQASSWLYFEWGWAYYSIVGCLFFFRGFRHFPPARRNLRGYLLRWDNKYYSVLQPPLLSPIYTLSVEETEREAAPQTDIVRLVAEGRPGRVPFWQHWQVVVVVIVVEEKPTRKI